MSRGARRLTAQLFLRIDPPTLAKLKWLAEHEGRDASSLVRFLVARAYGAAAHTDDPPQPKTEGEPPT